MIIPDMKIKITRRATNIQDLIKEFNRLFEDLKPLNPDIEKIYAEKTTTGYILKIRFSDEFRKSFSIEDVIKLREMGEKRAEKQLIIDEIVGILEDKVFVEMLKTIIKKLKQITKQEQNNE